MGYACAMIVHTRADQLLPQLLMEQFDTLTHTTGTLDICMKKFDNIKITFDKMTTMRASTIFFWLVSNKGYAYAMIVHTGADQLLPQLLKEHFETLPSQ